VATTAPPTYITTRRSRRIWLTMPIRVSQVISGTLQWTEEASTLVVNAHGALILLHHEVTVGEALTISDMSTGAGRKCRVVMIGSRTSGMNEVGVELLEPFDDFWRAIDPPREWMEFRQAGRDSARAAGEKMKC
jgi:hypothetical protein